MADDTGEGTGQCGIVAVAGPFRHQRHGHTLQQQALRQRDAPGGQIIHGRDAHRLLEAQREACARHVCPFGQGFQLPWRSRILMHVRQRLPDLPVGQSAQQAGIQMPQPQAAAYRLNGEIGRKMVHGHLVAAVPLSRFGEDPVGHRHQVRIAVELQQYRALQGVRERIAHTTAEIEADAEHIQPAGVERCHGVLHVPQHENQRRFLDADGGRVGNLQQAAPFADQVQVALFGFGMRAGIAQPAQKEQVGAKAKVREQLAESIHDAEG